MLSLPLHKYIHVRKDTSDGITAIYLNTALRTLAISLVGFFLPVFLFFKTQEMFGEGIAVGLYGIIFYYLTLRIVVVLMLIPASKILSNLGFRRTMFISSIFLIILLGLLSLAEEIIWIIPFAAIVHGIQGSLYWLSYRSLFVKDGAFSHLGKEVSTTAIVGSVAAVAGPALGGIIITFWGFSALFVVALVVVVFSAVPFFSMQHHKKNKPATLKSVVAWLKESRHRNEELSFIGRNVEGFVASRFWPVYMFMVAGTYEKQGLVASLGLIVSIVMVYVAGQVFDKKRSYKIYKFGVFSTSFMWIVRGFIKTLGQLISVEVIISSLSPFYWVTYDSLLYERARGEDDQVLTFMVSRMFMVSIALFIVLGFVALVAPFAWRFWGMWGLAALGVLFSSLMWEERDITNRLKK